MSGVVYGRAAIRRLIAEVDEIEATPTVEAIAHVICVMGGHIPNQDNERRDACRYHLKYAMVAVDHAAARELEQRGARL